MASFDYHAITQQPVAFYTKNNNPLAILGLKMEFYIRAPDQGTKIESVAKSIETFLKQAQGNLKCYMAGEDTQMRAVDPDKGIDPKILYVMADREFPFFEIQAGVEENNAHFWSIVGLCDKMDREDDMGCLLITYPFNFLDQIGLDGFIKQFVFMCNAMEVEHAYAGPSFIEPFNVSGMDASHEVIGSQLFNYPCCDAYNLTMTSIHFENGIKSISFLTAVSNRILKKAGGAQAVLANAGQSTLSCSYSNGVIFQAGNIPQIGSSDFIPQEYINLGRALKPTRAEINDSLFDDPQGIDDNAFTQRWLSRFDGA